MITVWDIVLIFNNNSLANYDYDGKKVQKAIEENDPNTTDAENLGKRTQIPNKKYSEDSGYENNSQRKN